MKNKIFVIGFIMMLQPGLSLYTAKGVQHKSTSQANASAEDYLTDQIYKLDEVRSRLTHLKKLVGEKATISIIFSKHPDRTDSNYIIEVGYNSAIRFENYFTFEIQKKYLKSNEFLKHLKILDDDGDYVLLTRWRRTNPPD
jgi:hypothetical protein